MSTGDVQVQVRCLCRAHTFTGAFSRQSLPIETGHCHCTSCRHATGAMFSTIVPWPGAPEDILRSTLRTYAFTKIVTMFFCGVCSTPMFYGFAAQNGNSATFEVTAGVLPNLPDVNLIRVRCHLYVEDTVDGGAAVLMKHPNADGAEVACWTGMSNSSEKLDSNWPQQKPSKGSPPEQVSIQCHCRGVDFTLRRGESLFSSMDPGKLPFFVNPETHKTLVSCDPCDSCRLSCGTVPMYWTYALLKQMGFAGSTDTDGPGFPKSIPDLHTALTGDKRDPRLGTLTMYVSSAHAQRYFCSRCSACIFYSRDERPEIIDIALGVLDAPDGARAESLLDWNYGSMGYMDDVRGGWRQSLMEAAKLDSERWRVEHGLPKCFRRVIKEAEEAGTN